MCIPDPWRFTASCSNCGGDLARLTGGTYAGTEAQAVVKCKRCCHSFQLLVRLLPMLQPASEVRRQRRSKVNA